MNRASWYIIGGAAIILLVIVLMRTVWSKQWWISRIANRHGWSLASTESGTPILMRNDTEESITMAALMLKPLSYFRQWYTTGIKPAS